MINCLIIENDTTVVKAIKSVLSDFDTISFIETKEDPENALDLILKNNPELVFFNIDTIHVTISEFLLDIHQCTDILPVFIALSSSRENAFKAYKYDFSNFLLKPLNKLAVKKSILRYQKSHPVKQIETICLKSYKDYQYLNIDDIIYLKADNNTTDFYMEDGRIISAYKTLKVFENLLPQAFLRIHKSYIINKCFISRVHYGKSICILNKEYKIPFSKTFKANIDSINQGLSHNTIITPN